MQLLKKILSRVLGRLIFIVSGGVVFARWKGVRVGNGCRIYIDQFGSEPFLVEIGDNVTITADVKLLTHDGSTSLVKNSSGYRYQRVGRIKIGSNVFVGISSIILPGITIGDDVVVAAGSVVTKDVPSGCVVAGNPARKISDFDCFKKKTVETTVNDQELVGLITHRSRVEMALKLQEGRNSPKHQNKK
jgi:acetyltransferase-like isoleucine patch superfamily enzyme